MILNFQFLNAVFFSEWNPSKISRTDLFRGIELAMELILLEPETQISGVVGILNFGDLTLSHIFEANPSFASMAVSWIQEAVPVQVKAVYVVNNSILFNIVWTILKPFLSRDLTDKFYIERSDFARMAAAIGKKSLEKKYDGEIENNKPFGMSLLDEAEKYKKVFEGLLLLLNDFLKMNLKIQILTVFF